LPYIADDGFGEAEIDVAALATEKLTQPLIAEE
jgi:hypothetical protein